MSYDFQTAPDPKTVESVAKSLGAVLPALAEATGTELSDYEITWFYNGVCRDMYNAQETNARQWAQHRAALKELEGTIDPATGAVHQGDGNPPDGQRSISGQEERLYEFVFRAEDQHARATVMRAAANIHYKAITGKDWTPQVLQGNRPMTKDEEARRQELYKRIAQERDAGGKPAAAKAA